MALTPGTRLGPYEIVSLRGKGGMGEVYRGRDVRLGRDVAIKVLPREMAEDPILSQRLQREARTISQLRHPHICTLHDVGAEHGVEYLVMEYLEGETLDDRLSRGALPLDDVITIGGQIVEAVAAAHSAGVIHRDLKPGNVMLTKDGAKVLDFGLAKGSQARAAGSGSESPTITRPLTSEGSLVGTLLYMAPEQLEGKEADSRSDLWALGAMLYQMVTGVKPFTGASQANVMAAILTAPPRAVSELQPSTPPRLVWLIERCLEKNPERRWQSARDLALELKSLGEVTETPPPPLNGRSRRRSILLTLGGAVAILAALGIGALLGLRAGRDTGGPERERWTAATLDSTDALRSPFGGFGLSPDGRTVAVWKSEAGREGWYRRSLDSTEMLPLPPLFAPNFSPDGRQVAILDGQRSLRTMPLDGEPGSRLAADVDWLFRWAEDGYIYYDHPESAGKPGYWRVRATGGEPELVSAVANGVVTDVLPGSRTLLTWNLAGDNTTNSLGNVFALDVGTGQSRALTTGGAGTYLDPGYLIFCRDGALWAAPIHASTGELEAPARSIEEVGVTEGLFHYCRFNVSRSGNLLYVPPRESGSSRLVWVALDGTVEPVAQEVKNFFLPRPSLDGRQVSAQVTTSDGTEQWILDLASGSWSKPAQSGYTSSAMWVPPLGREILFYSDRDGLPRVYVQPADRSGPPKPLWPEKRANSFLQVSADGRYFILFTFAAAGSGFFVLDHLTGEVRTVIEDGTVHAAAFDLDGDWIVYAREEQYGSSNLWLVPFPGPGEPRQITFDGGGEPQWARNGHEIYYRSPTQFMSIPIEKSGGDLVAGRPRVLFEDRFRHFEALSGVSNYSEHPDGRLLMVERAEGGGEESLILVENWRAKVIRAFAEDGR